MKKSWMMWLCCTVPLSTTSLVAMHNGDNAQEEKPSIPMPSARVLDLDLEREVDDYFQRCSTQASQPEPKKSEEGQQQ